MVMINVMHSGRVYLFSLCSVLSSVSFGNHCFVLIYRCRVAGDTYEQIFSDPSSEISQICNKTIDDLTTMIGNFVKYG